MTGLTEAPEEPEASARPRLDDTLDAIAGKFGTDKLTRALALDRPARPGQRESNDPAPKPERKTKG